MPSFKQSDTPQVGGPFQRAIASLKAYVDRNFARGEVAYAQITSNSSAVGGTLTDVAGLSVTWSADSTRKYKVTVEYLGIQSTAGLFGNVWIRNGSNAQLMAQTNYCASTSYGVGNCMTYRTSGISGSQTMKVSIENAGSGGTFYIAANAAYPAFILVEDIGPA